MNDKPKIASAGVTLLAAIPRLLAVAFGAGTNSTAMLCGLRERDIKPDLILFADTGAEMPRTYEHVNAMADRVRQWWGMTIEVVRTLYQGKFEGLEGECLRGKKLPGLAYGKRACSVKYKHEPQARRTKQEIKLRGLTHCVRLIGFHALERHRAMPSEQTWATNWYPLIEWQWRPEECHSAMCRHGIKDPGKSSCFFCPAMKPSEVFNLREKHPDLLARALEIERRAQDTVRTPRGLGGEKIWWANWLENYENQIKLLDLEPMHRPCACEDGG